MFSIKIAADWSQRLILEQLMIEWTFDFGYYTVLVVLITITKR